LGIFRVYIDAWVILYIVLGFQVVLRCPRREALLWGGIFVASVLVSFFFEFGLISGFGRAMAYIVIGLFTISYDIQVAQHEDALEESQVLLNELSEAHEKLQAYAAQANQLAATQERDRIGQELYDSIGQKVFAIQLATEATRLMLTTDPQRLAGQLADLQAQTQAALGQMRQLIAQWRPG
jgi:signal transduction histidine kinase